MEELQSRGYMKVPEIKKTGRHLSLLTDFSERRWILKHKAESHLKKLRCRDDTESPEQMSFTVFHTMELSLDSRNAIYDDAISLSSFSADK